MPDDLTHLDEHIQKITAGLQLQALAAAGADNLDEHARLIATIHELEERTNAREAEDSELAFVQLAQRLGLSAGEQQVLCLLCAIALSATARDLVARWGRTAAPDPNLETLRSILFGARASLEGLAALAADGTLRRYGLIERTDGGGAEVHETRQTWAVSRRVLDWVHGLRGLAASVANLRGEDMRIPEETYALAVDALTMREVAEALVPGARPRVLVLAGIPGAGRRTVLTVAARRAGTDVIAVDGRRLGRDRELERQARALALECRLQRCWPLVTNLDGMGETQQMERFAAVLACLSDGPILATCGVHRPTIAWGRPVVGVEMKQPAIAQRAQLWLSALGQGTEEDGEILASHYPLAPALIVRTADAVRARVGSRTIAPEDITSAIRTVMSDRIGQYAKRVTVTQTWQDLVLCDDQRDGIAELVARVRGRGRVYEQWGFGVKVGKGLGISALLSGPPGTGKTMVAALVAQELGIDLYQVDMAKVVSKFIGETERNLGAVFDAAEAGHAILLFDEADALFGKRTDVKSSNDRYANLETNYLLQRLESFTGICVLTSNFESHIDTAFQRRLSLHLRFELPDAEERGELWRATIPVAAPVTPEIDFGALGRRFAMSGGYIRNATLRAAFLAADENSTITAAHLERAARVEYEGMGKLAA